MSFILRLPSAAFGVATIPVVYVLGRQIFTRRVGFIAAALLTVNTGHIAYSQEARGYTAAVLLCAVSAYLLLRALSSQDTGPGAPQARFWIGFCLISAMAVYTHFFCAFVTVAFALAVAVRCQGKKDWKLPTLGFGFAGLLAMPAVIFAATHQGRLDWVAKLSISAASKVPVLWAGSAAALVLYLLFWWKSFRSGFIQGSPGSGCRWRYLFLASWMMVPLAISVTISIRHPVLVDRFLLISMPPAILLAADGIDRFGRKRSFLLTIVILVSLGGDARLYQRRSLQDCRSAATLVLEGADCGDTILFIPDFAEVPFAYYRDRVRTARCNRDELKIMKAEDPFRNLSKHVWIVIMGPRVLAPALMKKEEMIAESLQARYMRVGDRWFEGFHIVQFEQLPSTK